MSAFIESYSDDEVKEIFYLMMHSTHFIYGFMTPAIC